MKIKYLCALICAIASLSFIQPAFAGGGEKVHVPGPHYKEMPPLTVTVIRDGQVTNHVTFLLVLEVDEETDIDEIKRYFPLIQNEFVNYLHGIASNSAKNKLNDQEFLKRKLKAMANHVMGKDLIQQVLFKMQQDRHMVVG